MRKARLILLVLIGFILVGYRMPKPEIDMPVQQDGAARKIAIFFDGTENGPSSRTNVYKLYQRAKSTGSLITFYVEGVGFGGKPIGSGTGWGIDLRIQQAYAFLLRNYRKGDELHIFGFSRGAFSARILAALLNYAGLPRDYKVATVCALAGAPAQTVDEQCSMHVSQSIYEAYKGEKPVAKRIQDVELKIKRLGLAPTGPVTIETLGLWDTVEALGAVDTWEALKVDLGFEVKPDPGERNKRYGDQLCNVGKALQALSIDDNRADVFTPKLLTLPHLYWNCPGVSNATTSAAFSSVNEVWFPGAHSDVGGGYNDCRPGDPCISDITLNWMTRQLCEGEHPVFSNCALLPIGRGLYKTHDAEDGSFLYRRVNRNLRQLTATSPYNNGKPKIHCSVIQQLAQKKPESHEFDWGFASSTPAQAPRNDGCFDIKNGRLLYKGSEKPVAACEDEKAELSLPACWFTVVK